MLPDQFRINVENQTGGTIDASLITIKYRGKYFDATGTLTFESESSDIANQGSGLTDTSFTAGTTVDNGAKADPLIEADIWVSLALSTNTATPSGSVNIYLQRATADTANWPTNGEGDELLGSVEFTSKTDKVWTRTIR